MGAVVAALAYRLGIAPNAITVAGLTFMLTACFPYALGVAPAAWILAAILWQIGFAFDCADGQLARATGTASPFGAWLDVACDHIRQSAMALALLYVLIQASLPLWAAVIGAFVLIAGQSVYLHTASFMNAEKPSELSVRGLGALARQCLRFALDTPVFLLVVCVLRPWPRVLLAYCVFHGLMLLLRAVAIGANRLRA
jgi:phosphatidylglycerophosphate synthase